MARPFVFSCIFFVAWSYRLPNQPPRISPTNLSKLKYSQDEYLNWDGYAASATYVPPPPATPMPAWYRTGFENALWNLSFATQYDYYRGYSLSDFDMYTNMMQQQNYDGSTAISNVSFAMNEAYNQMRLNGATAASLSISTMDWTALPHAQEAINWISTYLNSYFGFQLLTHQTQASGNFDTHGYWKWTSDDVWQPAAVWDGPTIPYAISRMARFLPSSQLRQLRTGVQASLSAWWRLMVSDGARSGGGPELDWGEGSSTAQWLLRPTGATVHTNFLLLSEKILRARGDWSDSSDRVTSTDRVNGRWTNDDALNLTITTLTVFATRMQYYGINEFLSTYNGYQLDTLAMAMQNAPSAQAYTLLESIYRRIWWDLLANYLPGAGGMSGPSNRCYDSIALGASTWDSQDAWLYAMWAPQAWCDANAAACSAAGWPNNTIFANKPNSAFGPNYRRLMVSMWEAGGRGYVPWDVVETVTAGAAYRSLQQRYNLARGQERFNFLCPWFSLGFAGDMIWEMYGSILTVARLAGSPRPELGIPKQKEQNGLNIIRLMLDVTDNPFAKSGGDGPISNDIQQAPRQFASQYQGFMLYTSLAASSNTSASLNTNIMVPLAVDGLWADDYALPLANGSSVCLPETAILTVQHGGAAINIRLLRFERSINSTMRAYTTATPITDYVAGSGRQPCALLWMVDTAGYAIGGGRFVLHHKHVSDKANRPYLVSMLWGGGLARSTSERQALQKAMRDARLQETMSQSNWTDDSGKRFDGNEQPGTLDPLAWIKWMTNVTLNDTGAAGRQISLVVNRTDVYQPWGNSPGYSGLNYGFQMAPFYCTNFSRTVNGAPILEYAATDDAFRMQKHLPCEWFQPHLANQKLIPQCNSATAPPPTPPSPPSPPTPPTPPTAQGEISAASSFAICSWLFLFVLYIII